LGLHAQATCRFLGQRVADLSHHAIDVDLAQVAFAAPGEFDMEREQAGLVEVPDALEASAAGALKVLFARHLELQVCSKAGLLARCLDQDHTRPARRAGPAHQDRGCAIRSQAEGPGGAVARGRTSSQPRRRCCRGGARTGEAPAKALLESAAQQVSARVEVPHAEALVAALDCHVSAYDARFVACARRRRDRRCRLPRQSAAWLDSDGA